MRKILLIFLALFTFVYVNAQDLVSGGANSWIFHTPDDGRTTLHVAPLIDGNWKWSHQTSFLNNGNVLFNGNIGIRTATPLAKLHVNNGDHSYGTILANASESNFSLYAKTLTTQPANIESFRLGLKYATDERNGFISFYRGGSTSGGFLGFSTNGAERIRIANNGNIGMNTNNPTSTLDVNGKTTVNALKVDGNNPISSVNGFSNRIEFTGGGHGAIVFHPGQSDELMFGLHTNGNFYWGTGRSATRRDYYAMYLDGDTGNLGIRGKLTSNEVQVKIGGWADYVFKDNYQLPTLQQVENHIKEKGHLKNIPSAKAVEQNGIDLGEMNKLLLEKIEELTLYTITQEKQLEKQQKELQTLKEVNYSNTILEQRVQKLEKLVNNLLKTPTNEK